MSNYQFDFSNQAAIVTGAGAGIPRVIALTLAERGAAVLVNDLNPDRVNTLVGMIRERGGRAEGFQGDVSNRFQAAAMIETARDSFGHIHYLINGAGIYKAEPMLKIDEWDWRRQIEVNVIGTFFCTQLLGRVMADEGGGTIVNIASTAGHPGTLPQGIGYVTSQASIVAMTKQAARELAPQGVRVNAVCPGNIQEDDMPPIETPMNAQQRIGGLDEIAAVVLFLCSDAASFITGQAINVDGGENML